MKKFSLRGRRCEHAVIGKSGCEASCSELVFQLKAGVTGKIHHECTSLLEGDKTHLVFRTGFCIIPFNKRVWNVVFVSHA